MQWTYLIPALPFLGALILILFSRRIGKAGVSVIGCGSVGIAALIWPIGWPLQWLIFGVLSLVTIAVWVRFTRRRPTPTDRPYLNRRAEQNVGQEALLDQPIAQGFGRITLGDTVWRVSGPDLPLGTRVRVVGAEGNVLKVEPIA